jgi:hypothetical protein
MVSDIIDRNPFEEEEEIQNDFVGTNPLEDLLENPLENPVETSDHKEEKCLEQFDLD